MRILVCLKLAALGPILDAQEVQGGVLTPRARLGEEA